MGIETSRIANFQINGGSFFAPETMEPLAERLRRSGHSAEVAYDMPTQDKTATAENHARVLANRLRGLSNAILVTYSGGSGPAERAMEILEEEDGEHPVVLSVLISGSLGPLPAAAGLTVPRPRNRKKFRDGLELMPEPDGRTRFNRDMALDVFFNTSRHIGHIAVPGMIPVYRVAAPTLPEKLHAPTLYLLPRFDEVRDLESVLETAWYYRHGPNKMHVRITEGDHALPLADPEYLGSLILDGCVRLGVIPPPAPETTPTLPTQRTAQHNAPTTVYH